MGALSFCSALDLDMLSFESQNEQDVFMKFLRVNSTFTFNKMGKKFNIYLGAYAVKKPAVANGFVWYRTGRSTTETLTLDWYAGEPNNMGDEMCGTIMQNVDLSVGMNDYPCTFTDFNNYFNNTIVCQYKFNSTSGGYRPKFL